MQIRPANLEDVGTIVGLLEASLADKSFFHGNTGIDKTAMSATVTRLCRSGEMLRITQRGMEIVKSETWIGEVAGKPLACLIVADLDNRHGAEREAYMVAVTPEARGQKLGSVLLDFFCSHYAAHPLYAQCYPSQRLMAEMLPRRGFVQYGKTHGGNLLFRRLPEG